MRSWLSHIVIVILLLRDSKFTIAFSHLPGERINRILCYQLVLHERPPYLIDVVLRTIMFYI